MCVFLDLLFSLLVEFLIKLSLSEKEVKKRKGKENWIGRYKEKKIKRRNSSLRKGKERRHWEREIK